MKQITLLITAIVTITILVFSGCDKNALKPGEDDDLHPVVWKYKYNQLQQNSDVIPAMDENGNIFFSIQEYESSKDVYVFAIDKDGNELWNKQYSSTNYVKLSRVMYIDGKVIYTTIVYDDLYDYQETIHCLDAISGAEIWTYSPDFITEKPITAMAATSNYLVVAAKWGGVYPDIDELHYFDITSGTIAKSVDFGDDEIKLISIVDNTLYLGIIFSTNGSYTAPKVMSMDFVTNSVNWTFSAEYGVDLDYVFEQRSLSVDANGRVFTIIRKVSGLTSNIYILNNDGSLANTIEIPDHNSDEYYNILIDKNNNFYTAIPVFAKYDASGNQIWEFYSGTTVKPSNLRTGCVIGDNDTIYHAEDGGILNVNTIGEIAWAKYEEPEFTKPGYPLLTNEGNMVVVGNLYVNCIKGDGAKIQNAPWPRVYQNNGNTASR